MITDLDSIASPISHFTVTDTVEDVPWYSGVMPRADTCLSVEKVHLALLRGPLLCKKT